jgi:hypothetical protein
MKRLLSFLLLAVFVSAVLGCGLTAREIKTKSQSDRTDIFGEVTEEGPAPKGLVDLIIKASVKTQVEGYYFFEPEQTFPGQPDYPFLINIDGQAVTWRVAGQKETTPVYDDQGRRDLEGGEGIRYILTKRLRLTPGPHHLILGLPGEDFLREVNLTLLGDGTQVIEFKPVYRAKRGDTGRSFLNGVNGGQLFLNKNPI